MKERSELRDGSFVSSMMMLSAPQVGTKQSSTLLKETPQSEEFQDPHLSPLSSDEIEIFLNTDFYMKHLRDCQICQDIFQRQVPGQWEQVVKNAHMKEKFNFSKLVIWLLGLMYLVSLMALMKLIAG